LPWSTVHTASTPAWCPQHQGTWKSSGFKGLLARGGLDKKEEIGALAPMRLELSISQAVANGGRHCPRTELGRVAVCASQSSENGVRPVASQSFHATMNSSGLVKLQLEPDSAGESGKQEGGVDRHGLFSDHASKHTSVFSPRLARTCPERYAY